MNCGPQAFERYFWVGFIQFGVCKIEHVLSSEPDDLKKKKIHSIIYTNNRSSTHPIIFTHMHTHTPSPPPPISLTRVPITAPRVKLSTKWDSQRTFSLFASPSWVFCNNMACLSVRHAQCVYILHCTCMEPANMI